MTEKNSIFTPKTVSASAVSCDCGCDHSPRPRCYPQPVRPISVDDNVPYNPATYKDIEDVVTKVQSEALERYSQDQILSGSIASVHETVVALSEVVNNLTPGGDGSSIVLDTAMSSTSKNAVQNKVITAAIDEVSGNIDEVAKSVDALSGVVKNLKPQVDVDSNLSTISNNPVQNKVVTRSINSINDKIDDINDKLENLDVKIEIDDTISSTSENPVQNKVIATALEGKLDAASPSVGLKNGETEVKVDDGVVTVTGELLVDNGFALTENGTPTNDIVPMGYHFKYMDCTHLDKDSCIDFYLADGLWSYDPLMELWNDVHDSSSDTSLEDGHGVFDSTWKCLWTDILNGSVAESNYRKNENSYYNCNPIVYLRNKSNYDTSLELVSIVGNRATCRIANGNKVTMFTQIGGIGSQNCEKIVAGERAPYEGGSDQWDRDYKDDVTAIADSYALRLEMDNIGVSVLASAQAAVGHCNQVVGRNCQAVGTDNLVSGKWGGAFGYGLHQLGYRSNVYGAYNRIPLESSNGGSTKYPVVIGCGLSDKVRRDGLKFDRNGDAIFDGHTTSRTFADLGIQHFTQNFTGKTAVKLFDTVADAIDNKNQITDTINFRGLCVNDADSVALVSSKSGLFWMSRYDLRNASGTVIHSGGTYAIRCSNAAGNTATDAEFKAADFEVGVYARGKFFVPGALGLFWSEDGKTFTQSKTVGKKAGEIRHFHNAKTPHWWHIKCDYGTCFVNALPETEEDEVVKFFSGSMTAASTSFSGTRLVKTADGYGVEGSSGVKPVEFIGGIDWWRQFADVFMFGNYISFDPSDDEGWIGGTSFGADGNYLNAGNFVSVNVGVGVVLGFRAYCHDRTKGLQYSVVSFTDAGKASLTWTSCGGYNTKNMGIDSLSTGVDRNGDAVLMISPLWASKTADLQPLYVKNGGTSVSAAGFPYAGTPLESGFVAGDGTVVVMFGTSTTYDCAMFWTNYLNGSATSWHKSNMKDLPWISPRYLETVGMYVSTAYCTKSPVMVSKDAKYWLESDVESVGNPPMEFGGKVYYGERNMTGATLYYLNVGKIDETYNLGPGGSGGSLSQVKQITEPYTDKIVRAKVNEIIVALGGRLEQIPETYTDEDIKDKVNEIIAKYS